jgi:hypothetical protein
MNCTSCGQPVPSGESSCPNCGRKIKDFVATTKASIETPSVASFCNIIGCLAIIAGGLLLFVALVNTGAPDFGSGLPVELSLVFSSVLWFVAARGITLLAQIAHNTRRD